MSEIIKIGTQDATFKVGSSAVTAIFLGSNQVYPNSIPPTPSYQWVSYTTGDTVPTATTVFGVKLYENYDEGYNVIFSGTTGDYIKFHPNGNFGQWAAEDENGTPIDISSYISYQAGRLMYTIEFSDLGLGGMNIISPTTIFEDDIDLYT